MSLPKPSGTGKTATFSIAMLQSINVSVREMQALVLLPRHKLAMQTQSFVLALGNYMNMQCHACISRTFGEDMALEYSQHIVSGTPRRVFDRIRRQTLCTCNIKMLILDEADELLNKGFNVMFRLGLVVVHERSIQTTIGTVFVHISYFPHAQCVMSCVVSCVGHVLCCALLQCSTVF
jgi:superfamily II DNA/RNA helicase